MEKELIMNEEMETGMELDTYDEPEVKGRGLGKLILGAGGAVVIGGVALFIKNKKKAGTWMEEHKIKKLEKKGYVVIKPEGEVIEQDCSEVEETEE